MLKKFMLCVAVTVAMINVVAFAAETRNFNIPPGDLAPALESLAKETGLELIFQPEELKGIQTQGVSGILSPQEAVARLIDGTQLTIRTDSAGAILIAPATVSAAVASPAKQRLAQNEQSSPDTEINSSRLPEGDSADKSSALEEIVVTAQKRAENLQEVPVPVSVLNADSLVENNQTRIQDYFTRIPGLNVTPSVQGQQNVTIRGITTGFSNPTVGVVIDDVPFGGSGGRPSGLMVPDIDPGDLQRVEVLKGPQGALYGASSMGGLFKLVTVDPSTDALSGRISAGFSGVQDSDDLGRTFRGMINVPVSDTLAVRASGFKRDDPGYIDNVQTGEKDVNRASIYGGHVSTLWKPVDNLSVKLSAIYQDYDGEGQSEVDNLAGLGSLEQSRLIDSGDFSRKTQAYSALVNATVGRVGITAVSGYNEANNVDLFDFTAVFGPPAFSIHGTVGVPVVTLADVRRFTQELRFSIPVSKRIDWLVGGFYSRESNDFDQQITFVNPANNAFVANRSLIDNAPLKVREYSAFTDVTIYLSDRFDLQLGGRHSRMKQWVEEGGTAQRFPPAGNGQLTVVPGVRPDPDTVFTQLITPRFKISDSMMVYARVASGYRIGGTNTPDRCVLFNYPCQYGPDKTYNYEMGTKGDLLDQRLSFDASIFYIDWKDIQIQRYSPLAANTFNTNGSRAKSEGIEFSLVGRPTPNLTLSAWGSYNNAELIESLPVGPNLPLGANGDPLPLSVRRSGSVSIDQRFVLSNELSSTIGGSVTYIGERPSLFVNAGARTVYPAYTKVDLAGRLSYKDWTGSLYINNLTDEYAQLSGGPGFFPAESAAILQPRTFGMSLSKAF